jgi:hypothetical protein
MKKNYKGFGSFILEELKSNYRRTDKARIWARHRRLILSVSLEGSHLATVDRGGKKGFQSPPAETVVSSASDGL